MGQHKFSIVVFSFFALILSSESNAVEAKDYEVEMGDYVFVESPFSFETVYVTDPNVVNVKVLSRNKIVLNGISVGATGVIWVKADGATEMGRVRVTHSVSQIGELLTARFPDHNISLHSAKGSLKVMGSAGSVKEREEILKAVMPFLANDERLIDEIVVGVPSEVRLQLKFVGISRSLKEKVGVSWNALINAGTDVALSFAGGPVAPKVPGLRGRVSGNDVDIDSVISLLSQQGLAVVLAEPSLVASNGVESEIKIGGEIPIPVPSPEGTNFAIEYKQFGIVLRFTPNILSDELIDLKLNAEVSDIAGGNLTVGGNEVPVITNRYIDTAVVLAHRHSFAIGSLTQSTSSHLLDQLPGVEDVPVLGALFTQKVLNRDEAELVIVVTAEIVDSTTKVQYQPPSQRARSDVDMMIIESLNGIDPAGRPLSSLDAPHRFTDKAGFVY